MQTTYTTMDARGQLAAVRQARQAHTHGPNFGRRVSDCPRCAELSAGAPAQTGWGSSSRRNEARRIEAIRVHDCAASHCGPVCTAFDW